MQFPNIDFLFFSFFPKGQTVDQEFLNIPQPNKIKSAMRSPIARLKSPAKRVAFGESLPNTPKLMPKIDPHIFESTTSQAIRSVKAHNYFDVWRDVIIKHDVRQ